MSVQMHRDVVRAVEAVLVMHQRHDGGGGCWCGALDLGESYTQHVAEVLGAAGLLLRWPPKQGG